MKKLRVLDLFSGIGGFSLGLERTGGFETVAFCEIEEYPRRVLAKHWPGVPIYEDVMELTGARLAADGIAVDVICGGFPCQDLSTAGNRAGLEGARSGLWFEYARLIGELRPRFVVVENVPGLLSLGMGAVLGDLSTLGYDAVWDCIPAAAVGAPHRRDRVWLIANDAMRGRRDQRSAKSSRRNAFWRPQGPAGGLRGDVAHPDRQSLAVGQSITSNAGEELSPSIGAGWWASEPDVGRVADGVPARTHRLRALGNAVVPQIPEMIGRAILEAMQ